MDIKDELKKLQAQSDEVTSRIKELKEALTKSDYKWFLTAQGPCKAAMPDLAPTEFNHLNERGLIYDSREECEKHDNYLLALAKVVKAIKVYNGDWEVDFSRSNNQTKWLIGMSNGRVDAQCYKFYQETLTKLYVKDAEGVELIYNKFKPEVETILTY
jgi:hypothetical protein